MSHITYIHMHIIFPKQTFEQMSHNFPSCEAGGS